VAICASVNSCRRVTCVPLADEAVDQGAALDAERTADRYFGRASIEGGDHRGEFLGLDDYWPAAAAPAPPPGCLHALLRERTLELRKNKNALCGVMVSICSVKDRNAIQRSLSWNAMSW